MSTFTNYFGPVARFFSDLVYEPLADEHQERAFNEFAGQKRGKCERRTLRVMSQNMYGVPISPDLDPRCLELCRLIKSSNVDIIAIQEVAANREADAIRSAAREVGLIFTHRFPLGVGFPFWKNIGTTGQMVLCRYPIVEVMYRRFSINGKPYKFLHCDYLGAKGVGLCRVMTPFGMVDVYVTHFHASYTDDPKDHDSDEYFACRLAQSYEFSQFIRATSQNPLQVILGDFNSSPDSIKVRLIHALTNAKDAFFEAHNLEIGEDHDISHTFLSTGNTFKDSSKEPSQKLDYILFLSNENWKLLDCSVVKKFASVQRGSKKEPERVSLSDHDAVIAEFEFSSASKKRISSLGSLDSRFAASNSLLKDKQITSEQSRMENIKDLLGQSICILQSRGLENALSRYSGHLLRLVLTVVLLVLISVFDLVAGSLATLLFCCLPAYGVVEFLLLFFFVSDEISSFRELIQEMKFMLYSMRLKPSCLYA